jgi:uncharacterized protein
MKKLIITLMCLFTIFVQAEEKAPAKKLKAIIVAGGCCHDYEKQKKIIADGLAERINISCDIIHEQKADKMKEALSKKGWADNYDLVIYNFCHAHEKDKDFVESITKIHHEGKAAIALHCSMHTYHWKIKEDSDKKKAWTELLGVTSPNHGPKSKIEVTPTDTEHPIMKGFPAKWVTPNGELYNIKKIHDSTKVLAMGVRTEKGNKSPTPCIWVNTYGKGKVFGMTLGHYNETVKHKTYLDLLSRAALWTTNNLK